MEGKQAQETLEGEKKGEWGTGGVPAECAHTQPGSLNSAYRDAWVLCPRGPFFLFIRRAVVKSFFFKSTIFLEFRRDHQGGYMRAHGV